jgi:hypothetical protein
MRASGAGKEGERAHHAVTQGPRKLATVSRSPGAAAVAGERAFTVAEREEQVSSPSRS